MKKRTVSIKRTVWEIFLMTLLNVPYDPKIKTIIALSYRTYNRVFRVHASHMRFSDLEGDIRLSAI